MFQDILAQYTPTQQSWQAIALALATTLVVTGLIAKTYEWTYQGLSWSPALVQSFILGSLISCMVMLAIGNNLAGAIGSMGFLALIRFRTNLRDPRDMVFTFACLGAGVAAGMHAYPVVIAGSLAFCAAALAMRASGLGTRGSPDGLVRFQAENGEGVADAIAAILTSHTRHFALVTMREVAQGHLVDYAYQVKLADSANGAERKLLGALERCGHLTGIIYMNQQATVEV